MKRIINNLNYILCIILLTTIVSVSCTSTSDFQKAKQKLEQQGYTEVEKTGYDWFCCGEDDSFSTGFKAKDIEGNVVTGCICSGVMKGSTIRFD